MKPLQTRLLIPALCPKCRCEFITPASLNIHDGVLMTRGTPPQQQPPPQPAEPPEEQQPPQQDDIKEERAGEDEPDWGRAEAQSDDIVGDVCADSASVPRDDGDFGAASTDDIVGDFGADSPSVPMDYGDSGAASASVRMDDASRGAGSTSPLPPQQPTYKPPRYASSTSSPPGGKQSALRGAGSKRPLRPQEPKCKPPARLRTPPRSPQRKRLRFETPPQEGSQHRYGNFEYDDLYWESRQTMSHREAHIKWNNRMRATMHQQRDRDD